MNDVFLTAILPYAIMVGIGTSVIAAITVVVSAFLKSQKSNLDLLPRLAKIEAALKSESSFIAAKLQLVGSDTQRDNARSAVNDLDRLAHDLQQQAKEVHKILEELEVDGMSSLRSDDRRSFSDLSRAVGQTETYLETLVRKLDEQKRAVLDNGSSTVANQG